jgi:hypothetical protein
MEVNEYHIKQQEPQLIVLTMINLSYIIPDMKTNTDERTEERKNRFNGESILLTKEEARRHDCIFLAEIMATLDDKTKGTGASKHWDIMRDHLNWFRKNNAKAYMVLLD